MSKGEDFEKCTCLAAWESAQGVGVALPQDVQNQMSTWSRQFGRNSDVRVAGRNAIPAMQSAGVDLSTVRHYGAAVKPSPKTDIIAGNFKISCKWEDKGYQLASGGIDWTFNNLRNALMAAHETGDVPFGSFMIIDEILNDYAQTFGVGRQSKASIDGLLGGNQALQQQISMHLGPVSSNADASRIHRQFNRAIVHEALTGNEQWGETSAESANYVLGNQSGFHEIDQNYVNTVARYYSVRPYARKGRGSDPDPNISQQELVGRLEVTEGNTRRLLSELGR